MALSADRNTPYKDGDIVVLAVAAAIIIYAGALVAKNTAGYIVPAADAAGNLVVGRADEYVDNTNGANGDVTVEIRRNKVFSYANSAGNACTVAHLMTNIYVEDDETVASAGGVNSIVAGKMVGLDSTGVQVEVG